MRAFPLILVGAGCFSPTPPTGQLCIDWCPPPEVCVQGVCNGVMTTDAGGGPVPVNGNYMFVTSDMRGTADLGGVAGADAWCNELAAAARLPGTYVAWTSGVYDRLFALAARSWYRVDGRPFADTLDDLLDGRILYPPRLTENGDDIAAADTLALVGTGTYDGSDDVAGLDCAGLTGTVGTLLAGVADGSTFYWTGTVTGSVPCGNEFRMYCLGTDRTEAVVVERPASYRYAFVSADTESVGTSISDFDAVCQTQAAAAGLGVVGTPRTWIATSTLSANERIPDGADFIRPDGVVAMTGDKSEMLAAINVDAEGNYLTGPAWSGAADPTFRAGKPADACENWASATGTTRIGVAGRSVIPAAFGGAPTSCGITAHVYCLEE